MSLVGSCTSSASICLSSCFISFSVSRFVNFSESWFCVMGMAGKGSYGAVYKARDLKTSELVAIKVISLSQGVCFCHFFRFHMLLIRRLV